MKRLFALLFLCFVLISLHAQGVRGNGIGINKQGKTYYKINAPLPPDISEDFDQAICSVIFDTVGCRVREAYTIYKQKFDKIERVTKNKTDLDFTLNAEIKWYRYFNNCLGSVLVTVKKKDETGKRKYDRTIVYDLLHHRQLELSDIFTPTALEDIQNTRGKNFRVFIMQGGSVLLQFSLDKELKQAKFSIVDNKAVFQESFLELMSMVAEKEREESGSVDLSNQSQENSLQRGEVSSEEGVFDVVERMPEFPGGNQALFKYLSTNIKYPVVAEENGIQGRVVVTFVVEKDGSISHTQVEKSVDPSLDKEAIRVVLSMPLWKPGIQKGKPVRVKYTLPITFRLPPKSKKKRSF